MADFFYDLHIHSCLSPCGDEDNTPCNIAGMAAVQGLNIIALCDHNSAKNCPATAAAAKQYGLLFIPGMEVTTVEEVHVVSLFKSLEAALEFDKEIYKHLIKVRNNPEIFGHQYLYDENDHIIGEEENLLINATDIEFTKLFSMVEAFGGAAFPAHIDKDSNSLFANLGFIPPESTFKTVEVKNPAKFMHLKEQFSYLKDCMVLYDSDAHYLEHISPAKNTIELDALSHLSLINKIKQV